LLYGNLDRFGHSTTTSRPPSPRHRMFAGVGSPPRSPRWAGSAFARHGGRVGPLQAARSCSTAIPLPRLSREALRQRVVDRQNAVLSRRPEPWWLRPACSPAAWLPRCPPDLGPVGQTPCRRGGGSAGPPVAAPPQWV
jgi:hypothetical protein